MGIRIAGRAAALIALLACAGSAWADSLAVVAGGGQTGLSGASGSAAVVVEARDSTGQPIAGRAVHWSADHGLTLSAASGTTDSSGRTSVTFTYGDTGSATLVASDDNGNQAQTTLTAVGDNSLVVISGDGQSGQIGQTASAPIVVELRNASGSVLSGRTIQWSSIDGNTQLSSASSTTDGSGHASMAFSYVSGQPPMPGGTPAQIRATDSASGVSVTATVKVIGYDAILTVESGGNQSLFDEQTSAPIVVVARGWDGQPKAGVTVQWSEVGGAGYATFANATTTTDANGRTSNSFFCQYSNVNGLTGYVRAASDASSVDLRYSCIYAGGLFALTPSGTYAPAGQPAAPFMVELRDGRGQPWAGQTITWSVESGDATLGATSSVTDAQGHASVSVTMGTSGSVIKASHPTAFRKIFYSVSSSATTVVEVSGYSQSGRSGTTGATPMVVAVRDSAGNPVAGHTIHWSVFSGIGVGFAPNDVVTDANGQASTHIVYQNVGGSIVYATDLTSSDVAVGWVQSLGFGTLQVVSGDNQTGLPGTHAAQPVVVEYRDSSGAPSANHSLQWTVTSGDAVLDSGSATTDGNGRASIGYRFGSAPGVSVITIKEAGQESILTTALATAVGSDSLSLVSGNGQTGSAGSHAPQSLVVEVRDAAGNPASGRSIQWSATGGANVSSPTTLTDSSGRASNALQFPAAMQPGTGNVTATDVSTGRSVTFGYSVSVASAASLTVVSGAGQAGDPGTLASDPIVVELRDAGGNPVGGATITGAVTSGDAVLVNASATTTSNGQASFNVRFGSSGASVIAFHADGAETQVAVTTSSVPTTTLPGLTPVQAAVAAAVDNTCEALAAKSSLTPEEQDLLLQCQALQNAATSDPGAVKAALGQLLNKSSLAQSGAAQNAAVAQLQNVSARLAALRSGSPVSALSGLSFAASGGVLPLTSLMQGLFGEAADEPNGNASAGFGQWAFWASGTIGRGEARPGATTPKYDYDVNGLSFGLDRRHGDHLVFGAAVGYSRQNTDIGDRDGRISMTGWSGSLYGTYSFHDVWYLDGVVTRGRNDFDIRRNIDFTLPFGPGGSTTIHQVATGRPSGDLTEFSLTFGGDFSHEAWGFGPSARLTSSRLKFDAYRESLLDGPGKGLGLDVDARSVDSLSLVLGGRLSYTHSTANGVVVPQLGLEWQREFRDDPDSIAASFTHDPTHTPIVLTGDAIDNQFFRVNLGMSMMLTRGRSGFIRYERTIARERQTDESLALGFRVEF